VGEYVHTPFPQQVVVEVTAGCDQRCVFCGRTYMDRPKKTMQSELFYKIVEEIAQENPYAELWPTFMGEAMLLDCGLDRFIISCDAHTKETYERIRVGGRFERLYGGANRLIDTMHRQGQFRPLIEMQFSVFPENE